MRSCFFLLAFVIFALNVIKAQPTHTPLRKGDRAYDRVQYKEAEKQYRIAANHEIGNPQAVYNLGNTLYQQGNWKDAQQRFEQAASVAKDPAQRADALHNLGDAFLKDRKYKEAVKAYEASLRLRPGDPGTKQNLQMAKKNLREEEKKEKEKNQQQQQQQQNKDQNQSPQQNPQNQQDKQDKQENQSNQSPQNQQGQPQKKQPEQPQKMDEQQLKKEDAKRLLETAIGPDDRKNAQKYRAAQQQSKPKTQKKDW